MGRIKFKGLKPALKTFFNNGKYSKREMWKVASGCYDLNFQISYNDIPIIECVGDNNLNAISSIVSIDDLIKIYEIIFDIEPTYKDYNKVILFGIDLKRNTKLDVNFGWDIGEIEIENISVFESGYNEPLDFASLIDALEFKASQKDWIWSYKKDLNEGIEYIVKNYYNLISISNIEWKDDKETKDLVKGFNGLTINLAQFKNHALVGAIKHCVNLFNPFSEELCRRAEQIWKYNKFKKDKSSDDNNNIVCCIGMVLAISAMMLNLEKDFIRENIPRQMCLYEYLCRHKGKYEIFDNHINVNKSIKFDFSQINLDNPNSKESFFIELSKKLLFIKKKGDSEIVTNLSEFIINSLTKFENFSKEHWSVHYNYPISSEYEADYVKEWLCEFEDWFRNDYSDYHYRYVKNKLMED